MGGFSGGATSRPLVDGTTLEYNGNTLRIIDVTGVPAALSTNTLLLSDVEIKRTAAGVLEVRPTTNDGDVKLMLSDDDGADKLYLRWSDADNAGVLGTESVPLYIAAGGNNVMLLGSSSRGTAMVYAGTSPSTPPVSATLDLQGTNGALLLPRLTTAQRDALTGIAGMMVYNTTTSQLNIYTTSWVAIT